MRLPEVSFRPEVLWICNRAIDSPGETRTQRSASSPGQPQSTDGSPSTSLSTSRGPTGSSVPPRRASTMKSSRSAPRTGSRAALAPLRVAGSVQEWLTDEGHDVGNLGPAGEQRGARVCVALDVVVYPKSDHFGSDEVARAVRYDAAFETNGKLGNAAVGPIGSLHVPERGRGRRHVGSSGIQCALVS